MSVPTLNHGRSPKRDWISNGGVEMNRDRIEGKVKDVAGRIERQTGEWTGDKKMQVQGTAKQAEGKIQNAVGKAKDAVSHAVKQNEEDTEAEAAEASDARDRVARK
jgi:uncharacterized protein YjbJ (UPF0337 family)